MENLAEEAGLEKPPGFYKKMLTMILLRLFFSFPIFKTYCYSLSQDGSITEARNGVTVNSTKDLTLLVISQLVRLVWRDFQRIIWLLGSVVVKKLRNVFRLG